MGPDRRGARSYDEITRKTVPEVDSSFRPTAEQEHQAREGYRALDDQEQQLHVAVSEVLRVGGFPEVEVEIDRESVTLRGQVDDPRAIDRVEEMVTRTPGVARVINRLVVAP